jgi:PAS domain S-box-containing protein
MSDDQNNLREAELASRRLAAIVESSDDAIVSKDLNGIVTSWNVAAERMFGYAAEQMIGRSIRTIIPADRQVEEDEVLTRIRAGVRVDHFETMRERRDGTLIPISLTVSPIRDSTGRIVGASKIARDISEHRMIVERTGFLAEAGKALGASLDYASTLKTVATLAVPLIADWCAIDIVDDGRLMRLATAHADALKTEFDSPYNSELVIRNGRSVFLSEVDNDTLVQAAGGDSARLALLRSLKLRSLVSAPMMAGGQVLGTLTFATAESGRIFNERDVLFVEDVASRAALAIDNARAYEEARRASRLKDEFLATLSHELRTPLNAILGYVRMIQSGLIARDKQAKAIDTVARNATSLTHIIEDVLDVSRIVSGKLRLDVQPVDVARVVADAVESVQPAAAAKGVRLALIADPRSEPIAGDPERLQQLVWNLVANAVKFTPRDGQVQVRVERGHSRVNIAVSDTGAGIAPEFLPHVFERFRQADAGTTRKHGGLGLGLAITRHLVELHGGTIEASSDGVDKGSTFRVSLPVMIVHSAAQPGAIVSHPAADAVAVPNLRGVRILVVDDDSDALSLVREILEATGAEVATVGSGKAALQYVDRARPDVLIADLGMPEMDGFELISQLRHARNSSVRDVPAAALTAYARSEDRVKALRTGFQMHLAKPIDPGELMAAVASLAKRTAPNN